MANTLKPRPRLVVKLCLLLFSSSIAFVLFATSWLLTSYSAPQWLLSQLNKRIAHEVVVEKIEGRLSDRLTLYGLQYKDEKTTINVDQISLDWFFSALIGLELYFSELAISGMQIEVNSPKSNSSSLDKSNQTTSLPNVVLPFDIKINHFACKECQVSTEPLSKAYSFSVAGGLQYDEEGVQLINVDILSDQINASVNGGIHPQDNYPLNLQVTWNYDLATEVDLTGELILKGGIHNLSFTQKLHNPIPVTITGKLEDALDEKRWQAHIVLAQTNLTNIDAKILPVDIQGEFTAQGDERNYRLQGKIYAKYKERAVFNNQLVLYGNTQELILDELTIEELTSKANIHLNAKMDFMTQQLNINAEWQNVKYPFKEQSWLISDQGRLNIQGIPQAYDLDGAFKITNQVSEFDVTLDGHGSLDEINLEHLNVQALGGVLEGDGYVNWQTPLSAKADLTWKNVIWQKGEETLQSRGQADFSLDEERYTFDVTTMLDGSLLPKGNWRINGRGDLSKLDDMWIQADVLGGEIQGRMTADWEESLNWHGDITFKNINPASQWRDWPGNMAGELSLSGSRKEQQSLVNLELRKLQGSLRDIPVTSTAYLSLLNNNIDVALIELLAGEAQIQIAGRWSEQINMAWDVNVPNMKNLWPEAHGRLLANGVIRGNKLAPVMKLSIQGENLKWDKYSVSQIAADADLDFDNFKQFNSTVEIKNAEIDFWKINSLNLDSSGSAQKHQLNLTLEAEQQTLNLALAGSQVDGVWSADIHQFDLMETEWGHWSLARNASVMRVEDMIYFNPFCFASNQTSSLCVHGNYSAKQWLLSANGQAFPLDKLNPYIQEEAAMEGEANFEFNARKNAWSSIQASLTALMPETKLTLKQFSNDELALKESYFDIIYDAKRTDIKLHSILGETDEFRLRASLPEFDPMHVDFRNQYVNGDIKLAIDDVQWLASFIPEVDSANGSLNAVMQIEGLIPSPKLLGKVNLTQGEFDIPRAGIKLNDVNFQLTSQGEQRVVYTLNANSAKGELVLEGETILNEASGWPSNIMLRGQNFEVIKIPEAYIVASPHLVIETLNRQINVSGDVIIPKAKLQPKDLSQAVRVSEDMQILGQEEINNEQFLWQIHSEVNLILGDKVRFYGYGFEGNIAGNLLLIEQPGRLTTGKGELVVTEGRYRAYGQRLKIENGKLLFTGGPVSNPGLDIRAVRLVEDVVSGIKVRGTLLSPQLELFAQPSMGQANALSYLVRGKPLDANTTQDDGAILFNAALALGLSGGDLLARQIGDRFGFDEMRVDTGEEGEASLIIGRYLSPRLYISYGVGLIDAMDSVNLRYQLARHWRLEAEKHGDHQGSDLIFTIQR